MKFRNEKGQFDPIIASIVAFIVIILIVGVMAYLVLGGFGVGGGGPLAGPS